MQIFRLATLSRSAAENDGRHLFLDPFLMNAVHLSFVQADKLQSMYTGSCLTRYLRCKLRWKKTTTLPRVKKYCRIRYILVEFKTQNKVEKSCKKYNFLTGF
jgi:hypothetical protein